MKYTDKVEKSLRETVNKKWKEFKYNQKNKNNPSSYSNHNSQHISEESSSAKKCGILRNSRGVYTFQDNTRIWCVKRIKEGQQGLVVEILCRKYGDHSAPWFGIRIEETELGYVPTYVYLDRKSIKIDPASYPCHPGRYQDMQEIYEEIAKNVEGMCKRNAIEDIDADKVLFFIVEGKKYLLKHADETLKHDPELSPEERKTKMDEWKERVWFLESRLLK